MKKAVVLLSGGLYSTTVLYYAKKSGYKCHCLIFNYGQRHKKEIQCAAKTSKITESHYKIINISLPWTHSSLINKNKKLYTENIHLLEPWLTESRKCANWIGAVRKFEWQAGDFKKDDNMRNVLWTSRGSGIRVKRADYIPTLVAMGMIPVYKGRKLSPKELLALYANPKDPGSYEVFKTLIIKNARLKSFEWVQEDVQDAQTFMVKSDKFFLETGVEMDPEKEKIKLLEEIKYTKGFIKSVQSKLSNQRFVQNAPADVVEKERQKLDDGAAKLKTLEESLARLN